MLRLDVFCDNTPLSSASFSRTKHCRNFQGAKQEKRETSRRQQEALGFRLTNNCFQSSRRLAVGSELRASQNGTTERKRWCSEQGRIQKISKGGYH